VPMMVRGRPDRYRFRGGVGAGQVTSGLTAAKCRDDCTASTTAGAVVGLWDRDNSSAQQRNIPAA
jgi:hypothetical protein